MRSTRAESSPDLRRRCPQRVRDPDGVRARPRRPRAAVELDRPDSRPRSAADPPEGAAPTGDVTQAASSPTAIEPTSKSRARSRGRPAAPCARRAGHGAVDAEHPDTGRAGGDGGGADGRRAGGDRAGSGVDPHDRVVGRNCPDGALVAARWFSTRFESAPPRARQRGSPRARCRSSGRAGRRPSQPGRRTAHPRAAGRSRPRPSLAGRNVGGGGSGRERLDDARRLRQPQDRLRVRVDEPDDTVANGDRARRSPQRDRGAGRSRSRRRAPRPRPRRARRRRRPRLVAVARAAGQRRTAAAATSTSPAAACGEQQPRTAAGRQPGRDGRVDAGSCASIACWSRCSSGPGSSPSSPDQRPAGVGVDLERLGLAAGAVEREHQLGA